MIDLNLIVVISLAILAFFSFCTFIVIIPLAFQLSRTLSSAKFLFDTVNEFEPEVREVKQNIKNVKSVLHQSTLLAKSNMGETGVFLMSSVYGIVAGVKEYFSDCKSSESGYNDRESVEQRG